MKRIVVLGCAGSGKTIFARALGARLGAAVICLDDLWPPGARDVDAIIFRARVAELHAGEAWISDGNFAAVTFDIRLPRADAIVWIERPRLVCAWRVTIRALRAGEGHTLGGLPRVLAFIWGFDRINRPRIEALRMTFGRELPVIRLKSGRDVARFLAAAH